MLPRPQPAWSGVQFEAEYGRPVRISEYERPMLSDNIETAQTIAIMDELASRDAGDRAVVDATYRALGDAGLSIDADPADIVPAIFWFLKKTIRYVPTPGTSPLVDQTLVPPSTLLSMPAPWGDCPQFSMLASAMFRVCCIPSMFKTIAAEPEYPDTFSHVYNVVEVSPGYFQPFDSSNGPAPGMEYSRPMKRRIWPPVSTFKCRQGKKGTNMQRATYRNHMHRGYRNAALKGALGDNGDDSSDFYTPAGSDIDYSGTAVSSGSPDIMTGPMPTASELNQPLAPLAPSSTNYGGVLTTLANDAAQVAAPIVKAATQQAPYFITNPVTGQSVLYNPNTGTTGAASSFSTALSSISPVYLIGGVIVFALLAATSKGK